MKTINCRGPLLSLDKPKIMAIVNMSKDSFYEASQVQKIDTGLKKIEQMIQDGADVIDIGGQSTRPGCTILSSEEEAKNLMPFLEVCIKTYPNQIFSVDTFYSDIVRRCADIGVSIINDISGGGVDADFLQTVAAYQLPYICTHLRGTPQTMHQTHPKQDNLLLHTLTYFEKKIQFLQHIGMRDILLDIGIGFGKTIEENFFLLVFFTYQ